MGELTDLVEGAQATLDHIVATSRKIDSLRDRQYDAEQQFLYRLSTLYALKLFTIEDLWRISERYAPAYFLPEWEERWAETDLPALDTLMDLWTESLKYTPNGPGGSWTNYDPRWDENLPDWISCTPADDNPMPPRGQSVVYVLYDGTGTPCYVGSTGDFSARLKWHLKDRKPVVVWKAFPCEDREAAYLLEDRLLKEHLPYLNKKVGR